jgi:hypothetical protein
MIFNKIAEIVLSVAMMAQIPAADSTEVKTDSLLLYAPITGITIDSNKAMDQWARYLSKSSLSAQTKAYNIRQLCSINNTLDSLKGLTNKTDCGCDGAASFLSLKESFAVINQWKNSFARNGRIVYRK